MPEDAAFVELLVAFGNALREEGVAVGSGDVLTYCAAMAALDPTDLLDLYWAGHATLVTRRDQIPVYDRVFRRFFLDTDSPPPERARFDPMLLAPRQGEAVIEVPATDLRDGDDEREEATLGLVASDIEVWRDKSFAACTPEELAALRRIMHRIRLTPPRRCTRRTAPASDGRRPDPRRTVREMLRSHGEPAELFWRRRRLKVRPLVLILDVSGSMADYSRALLQFAYSTRRAASRVEVFCFGTRLTRITKALERRRPDEAMEQAAARGVRLGGRHPHRRRPRRVRARLGAAGHQPRRDRGDLLGRPRPG